MANLGKSPNFAFNSCHSRFCGQYIREAIRPVREILLRLSAVGDNGAMEAEPLNVDPPRRKRRWFQFSLRTLMIGVTLLAVPIGYVGWQAKIVRERTAMESVILAQFGRCLYGRSIGNGLSLSRARANSKSRGYGNGSVTKQSN